MTPCLQGAGRGLEGWALGLGEVLHGGERKTDLLRLLGAGGVPSGWRLWRDGVWCPSRVHFSFSLFQVSELLTWV